MPDFQLHPRLQQDCLWVGRFALSQLLLMNDAQYPWLILVPQRANISEIHQLNDHDRQLLLQESCLLAECMSELFKPNKLNIAAIGNLVPQLHVHHVARYTTDKAWPAPIWGKFPPCAYAAQTAENLVFQLRKHLQLHLSQA